MDLFSQARNPSESVQGDEKLRVFSMTAGELLGESKLKVPPFQRYFTWDADNEVEQLWNDLVGGIDRKNYFLGLTILARSDRSDNELLVVDGQQRIATILLITNAVRLMARRLGRELWGKSFEASMGLDSWRIGGGSGSFSFYSENDQGALVQLFSVDEAPENGFTAFFCRGSKAASRSKLYAAQDRILGLLRADLDDCSNPTRRLREWAAYLNESIYFAVLLLPDVEAGFEVYEIVNSRGRDLTVSELVKSFLIQQSNSRVEAVRRWKRLEEFLGGDEKDPMTSFVRHSLILDRGFFNRRDLYRQIRQTVGVSLSVEEFFDCLDDRADVYKGILAPDEMTLADESPAVRAFKINSALRLRTIRPVLMAIALRQLDQEGRAFTELLKIVIPRAVVGSFGTGAVEARFGNVAHRIFQGNRWDDELKNLLDLKPKKAQFIEACSMGVSKSHALVLRSVALSGGVLPDLKGAAHQIVTPRSLWPGESNAWNATMFNQLGNWILLDTTRRPYGTSALEDVEIKFPEVLSSLEKGNGQTARDFPRITAEEIEGDSIALVEQLCEVFYHGEL